MAICQTGVVAICHSIGLSQRPVHNTDFPLSHILSVWKVTRPRSNWNRTLGKKEPCLSFFLSIRLQSTFTNPQYCTQKHNKNSTPFHQHYIQTVMSNFPHGKSKVKKRISMFPLNSLLNKMSLSILLASSLDLEG
jgi:hypothetical protein